MIDKILELLNSEEYLGQSELIEIAKGKYKLPMTMKESREQVKRAKAMKNGN
jgi:hypothetical protein